VRLKTKQGLGYLCFCLVFIVSTALYFYDQRQNAIDRCINGRHDLRDAIEWTVTYALGFEADTDPSEIASNERFSDGLHDGLERQFPDEGCH